MSKLPYAPRWDLQALLSVSTSRQALSWLPALASVCPSEPPCPQAEGGLSRTEQRDPQWEGGALASGPGPGSGQGFFWCRG